MLSLRASPVGLRLQKVEEAEMTPMAYPYKTTECDLCGNLVPTTNLQEHLMADARILSVIQSSRPGWSGRECTEYLRALNGTNGVAKVR